MDDIDITSLAQVTETQVAYTPQLPLANGEHDVSLTVGNEASGWKFTITAPHRGSCAAEPHSVPAGHRCGIRANADSVLCAQSCFRAGSSSGEARIAEAEVRRRNRHASRIHHAMGFGLQSSRLQRPHTCRSHDLERQPVATGR